MSTEQSSNAPAKIEPKSVKDFLALPAYRGRFEEILSKRAPQFMASVTSLVTQSNYLARCEPKTVIASAFVAATLGFPVDKNLGFCFIVPYKDRASFQMGYKGYIQLALRSGQYESMNAKTVCKEAFGGYDKATGEPIIHWDKIDEDKQPIGYAFAWRLVTGFVKTCYWSKEKVEAHAKRYSQAYRAQKKDSPWFSNFDAMALKTVISNELRKWGILSTDLQTAIEHDQGSQDDIGAPVKHDDGTGLFDVEDSETLESALGDNPKSGGGKAEGNATDGEAYTEADLHVALSTLENYALNLSLSESKLIEQAKALNQTVPKDAKKLSQLPYATLQKLISWAKEFAAGNS